VEVQNAKVKLLTVACENRPGTLSYVARVLGDAKVNIVASHCGTIGQNGFVHVVVDVRKGKKALSAAELSYTEADVLLEELPNVAGALGYLTGKLARKEINISSSWGTTLKGTKKASVVLAVSDLKDATHLR